MSAVDEMVIGLVREAKEQLAEAKKQTADQEKRIEAHLERLVGRALMKIGVVGAVAILATVGGGLLAMSNYFHKMDLAIALQQQQLLQHDTALSALPGMRDATNKAKECCDNTASKLDGHLSPDVVKGKRP